ncbi:hypothetical protein P152DRAFT_162929 [Eremomyces bilateralis CBS 781.70]|uniref:Vacuolar protein sorting-associated protein 62 n=1 Tax=Eremomyces bilateralis CBS 781.70 TaxID=1392243 RepID=A0A6G1FUC6_9PEZI|nr:uncharacterized protein P152DRAFT_162929 [Eremomyces bilateralis CBS 781.70]KAF1809407.1 hypothetical protein P152DRAFT_162929 [Eremomyces bilateralis CBS 781.70]
MPPRRNRTSIFGTTPQVFGAITFAGLFSLFGPSSAELTELDETWIATSNSWLDRSACRWIGVCGLKHLNPDGWIFQPGEEPPLVPPAKDDPALSAAFEDSWREDGSSWTEEEKRIREIPSYVMTYAPYVHLYSEEEYWPSDVAEHLMHTTPYLNYTPAPEKTWDFDLDALHRLNHWGKSVYLQSKDNVEERPDWLGSQVNVPVPPSLDDPKPEPDISIPELNDPQLSPRAVAPPIEPPIGSHRRMGTLRAGESKQWMFGKKVEGGRSKAPATLVVVDKGNGTVDAFWWFFYSYNLGNEVFGVRFGNHVGDWEHMVVRFANGTPTSVFMSQHENGVAYNYDAVEKIGKRPVGYSATGTHAMYATPGVQAYILPFGLLYDLTDRGPLWDPALNMYSYTYNMTTREARSSNLTPDAPTGLINFRGHWGDKTYPLSDPRQYRFAGQYHYSSGPPGPKFHRLNRTNICQKEGGCDIRDWR